MGGETENRSITTSEVARLAYTDTGKGETLLAIHGLGGWRWSKAITHLAKHFRVVAPYLRGFGETSGSSDYTLEALAGDVVELIERLEIAPVHLIGHSLGGMVSQVIATERPDLVRTLVLISTTSHQGNRARAFASAMSRLTAEGEKALEDPRLRAEVEQVLRDGFPDGPPPVDYVARGLGAGDPAKAAAWRATVEFSRKDRLREIACPVLVVHGTNDLLIPHALGRLIHEAIPGSKFVELNGVGHSVQTEAAADLSAHIVVFLNGS